MSEPTQATAVPPQTPHKTKRPQRRTLQSGFSLLARGEPKIWLTGGMLVICLAMIVGLLSLIVINGLATFWPRPVEWLVLANNQMDIGEPQRTEVRQDSKTVVPAAEVATADSVSAESEPAESALAKPLASESIATSGTSRSAARANAPSRFYRTANFDITGRHYRWFEPGELNPAGIARPEWALVVERLSWGRLHGLPSRLALPIGTAAQSTELQGLEASKNLLQELASELETLTPTSGPAATPIDTPTTLPSSSEPSSAAQEPIQPSLVVQLTAALDAKIKVARSQQIHAALAQRSIEDGGRLQVQKVDNGAWEILSQAAALDATVELIAAREVWDAPDQILERIEPVLVQLSVQRRSIERTMREISRLDERLAKARIAVRQAELDTGRSALDQVDLVGPIIDRLVALERLEERLKASLTRTAAEFPSNELASAWSRLAAEYQKSVLTPGIASVQAELDSWRQSLATEPETIQSAADRFTSTWRAALVAKLPLEEEIVRSRAHAVGHELTVTIPSDAVVLEFVQSDAEQLKTGAWTAGARSVLDQQAIQPQESSTQVQQLTDKITLVSFDDAARGRTSLWRIQQDLADLPAVWLLPPQRSVSCDEITRIFPANRLSLLGKLGVYVDRWREFLLEDPREANTEGGVFPAIWGTVVMTLIMTLAVVPFGVIAALYLREYTRSGPIVSLVRISINNLAGVPSIVYGVFGLAFFCYSIGAFVDGGAKNADFGTLPSGSWYAWLATTVAAGVTAFMLSVLSSGPEHTRSTLPRWLARFAPWLWMLSLVGAGLLIFQSPFFEGFYQARLPTPTFGKEGLLWASLTLALLTLPVVIVATEEALSAVPNSLREGSLACGASKWQTIYRIVIPHARPGILTGAILAMARGIGEVAPLMLVGALPVAPDLPLDSEFPYFHGSRSFMHLGYQIYWLGFQSQNSEASKPLVFTCTLLLIAIVITLNLSAILLRARLRRRFQGNQF